jgi:uroporphyrinogen decarboxylase
MLTALDRHRPDRVPVWIHAINEVAIANIARLLRPDVPEPKAVNLMSQEEMFGLLDLLFVIHEELEIDGFTAMPLSDLAGMTNLDDAHFRDGWGTVWARSPHGMAYVVETPLKEPGDLDNYECPAVGPAEMFMVQLARQRFGQEKAVCFMMRGTFVRSWRLRGMEALLMDMVDRPAFVHRLAEMVTGYNLALCEQLVQAGADVLIVEDDVAGNDRTLMSPRHYRQFIAPYNRRCLDFAHRHGLRVVRHSDGNLWAILDDLMAMGYDGLNPLEPQAGMDLKQIKGYCGDRICLLGNIDCGDLLSTGSVEEVEAAVLQAIEDAAPGGGYVLCSSNSIHPGVRPENLLAMVRAAREHGVYVATAKGT